jgi:hypothetical protein
MATIFCTNCGGKHEYSGFAPNFCSKCGTPINGKSQKEAPVKKIAREDVETESEDNTDIDELPDIKKLDVEIEVEGGFRQFNLEELSKNPTAAKAKRFAPTRYNGLGDLSPSKYGSSKNKAQD